MKQQTAVEFAVEKLEKFIPSGNQLAILAILEQAKEMEKEQIVNSWDLSRRDIDYPANGEQYYNETYKNN
jgi:hypothetical protein